MNNITEKLICQGLSTTAKNAIVKVNHIGFKRFWQNLGISVLLTSFPATN